MYNPTISIPDPDDERNMPIFEGDPWDARDRLESGIYYGTADYTSLASQPGDGFPDAEPGCLVVYRDQAGIDRAEWIDAGSFGPKN